MDAPKTSREISKINELANEYKSQGFEVIIEPSKEKIPDFLNAINYSPDLIVKKGKDKRVIEVRTSESIKNSSTLTTVAELIQNNESWEFILVLTNPKESENKVIGNSFSKQEIEKQLLYIDKVIAENEEAAFISSVLVMTAIVESVLRFNLETQIKSNKIPTYQTLIRDARTQGVLSEKEYNNLQELYQIRNKAAHGFSIPMIGKFAVVEFFMLIKSIYRKLYDQSGSRLSFLDYLQKLGADDLKFEIDDKISESYFELLETDSVADVMAESNAFGWICEEYEIENINLEQDVCQVTFTFVANGEQDDDKPFNGDSIQGKAIARILDEEKIEFEVLEAELIFE